LTVEELQFSLSDSFIDKVDENIISTKLSKLDLLLFLNPSLKDILPRRNEEFHLYGLPQTIYKLHIDFDEYIIQILYNDPYGYIVLPEGMGMGSKTWNQIFSRRISHSAKSFLHIHEPKFIRNFTSEDISNLVQAITNRILFVRHMNEREYITLCSVCDVLLDPFPVGGGRSSLEALSVGTPIVMMKPRTSILQLTYSMYAILGINMNEYCCVAFTRDGYVNMVLYIGRNVEFQEKIRSNILLNKHLLFENKHVLDEWEKMLLFVYYSPKPKPNLISLHDIDWNVFQNKDDNKIPNFVNHEKKVETYDDSVVKIKKFNPLWRQSDLVRVYFTYAEPPILLRDVKLFISSDSSILKSSQTLSKSLSGTESCNTSSSNSCTIKDVNSVSQCDSDTKVLGCENDSHLLFNQSFTEMTLSGEMHSYSIIIQSGENWMESCLRHVRERGRVTDKLKILMSCAIVGLC
jgi:hypothetical protein